MSVDREFKDISVGDFVSFTRSFKASEWKTFAALSGDRNPLHWDEAYAAQTRYGRPIVPLHLLSSPLSAIAGMMIPGRRALYLGCSLRALAPLFFGEFFTYSARVAARSAPSQTLSLNVIGFRDRQILLEAEMMVQVRDDGLLAPAAGKPDVLIRHQKDQQTVVVTGANGGIGRGLVKRLSSLGKNILAIGRSGPGSNLPSNCQFLKADLATKSGRTAAARAIAEQSAIGCFVHLASPSVDAPPDELLAVNFEAFRTLADAALPKMLAAQFGRIILVGSTAVQNWPAGMEGYAAAKAAASAFGEHLWRRYSRYGVETITLAPSYVDTTFSAAFRTAETPTLLADEVAEAIVGLCQAERGSPSHMLLTDSGLQRGSFGFFGEFGAGAIANVPARSHDRAGHQCCAGFCGIGRRACGHCSRGPESYKRQRPGGSRLGYNARMGLAAAH